MRGQQENYSSQFWLHCSEYTHHIVVVPWCTFDTSRRRRNCRPLIGGLRATTALRVVPPRGLRKDAKPFWWILALWAHYTTVNCGQVDCARIYVCLYCIKNHLFNIEFICYRRIWIQNWAQYQPRAALILLYHMLNLFHSQVQQCTLRAGMNFYHSIEFSEGNGGSLLYWCFQKCIRQN